MNTANNYLKNREKDRRLINSFSVVDVLWYARFLLFESKEKSFQQTQQTMMMMNTNTVCKRMILKLRLLK